MELQFLLFYFLYSWYLLGFVHFQHQPILLCYIHFFRTNTNEHKIIKWVDVDKNKKNTKKNEIIKIVIPLLFLYIAHFIILCSFVLKNFIDSL